MGARGEPEAIDRLKRSHACFGHATVAAGRQNPATTKYVLGEIADALFYPLNCPRMLIASAERRRWAAINVE